MGLQEKLSLPSKDTLEAQIVCSLSPPPNQNKTKAGIAHFYVWVNNARPEHGSRKQEQFRVSRAL